MSTDGIPAAFSLHRDGVHDDTGELQRLLDAGHPIPPGQFRTTSTLTLQDPNPEEPMTTETQTLAERITSVLAAAGFRAVGDTPARGGGFLITPGVGATVSIAWLNARAGERAALLTKYENRLRDNGLRVENRQSYLYVPEPPAHLWPCGCLRNDAGAHRVGCPDHPEGVRG